MQTYQDKAQQVIEQVNQVIFGKKEQVKEIMLAFLANGHILLEDIPGVGKTTLALAFSKAMRLDYKRVQFTPDVLPSDLTGFSIYRREEDKFVYQSGSVFCNLLLADELNRTSPKTQSALLEVMEERKCTVEGVTREVPNPFLVIATQNPYGSAGVQSLPEAQLDRFMVTMTLGYPDFESELTMAKTVGKNNRLDRIEPVFDQDTLCRMQDQIHDIFINDEVYHYILALITATRNHPYIARGASPRATIALTKMAKASAWLEGRQYVTPNDVRNQFTYVTLHRILLNASARMGNMSKWQILVGITEQILRPSIGDEKS